jgi:hypothetical protein
VLGDPALQQITILEEIRMHEARTLEGPNFIWIVDRSGHMSTYLTLQKVLNVMGYKDARL